MTEKELKILDVIEQDYDSGSYEQQLASMCRRFDAEVARLRAGYREAIDDIKDWACYADDYFRTKHNLAGCIAGHEAALRGGVK